MSMSISSADYNGDDIQVFTRDSIYAIARIDLCYHPSVCPSVCLSVCLADEWIIQKRL